MPRITSAISALVRLRVLLVPMRTFIEITCVPLFCILANVLSVSAWPKVTLIRCASGTSAHTSSYTSKANCRVTSCAVPIGNSILQEIRSESPRGKNSVLMPGASSSTVTTNMMAKAEITIALRPVAQWMTCPYPLDIQLIKRFTGPNTALYTRPCFSLGLSQREQSMGTRVRAAVVDTIIMMLTIHPSCLNIIPAMPLIIVSGRNTHSMVRVDAITEIPTSDVPCTAASLGRSPLARWVDTFSSTTIASSTTMPMAMAKADIEMIFSVLPVANRYTSEARSAIGMDSTMINVDLIFPRNRNTTSITTRKVMMMVSRRVLMVLIISVDPSTRMLTSISAGSVGSILASCFLMPLITLTVLAPDCFWIMILAERSPSV